MKQQSLESASLHIGHGTHEGMVGKNNEDSYITLCYTIPSLSEKEDSTLYLNIVADGVGGQSAGERASQLTIETIKTYFDKLDQITVDDVLIHLGLAVTEANTTVYEQAHNGDDNFEGMATTIVVAIVFQGLLFISHIGDSRIYFLREDHLYTLSKDHSWVQEALDAGLITPEQAKRHPNRNIIRRSIGTIPFVEVDQNMESPWEPQFWQGMPLQQGDKILLCTDGLNDMISDHAIKASMVNEALEKTQFRVQELIDKANRAGGRDNITVILLEIPSDFKVNASQPIPPPKRASPPPPPPAWALDQDPPTLKNMPPVTKPITQDRPYQEKTAQQTYHAQLIILTVAIILVILILLAIYMGWIPFLKPPPPQ